MTSLCRSILSVCVFLLGLCPAAFSHELRPAIATLSASDSGRLTIEMNVNLEAAIAGIGVGHDDTNSSSEAQIYEALRDLSVEELRSELDQFREHLLERISVSARGELLKLKLDGSKIPPAGDTSLPRLSELYLSANLPDGRVDLIWRLDPRLGDSVVRLLDPTSGEVVGAKFVSGGTALGPLPLIAPTAENWDEAAKSYLWLGFLHIVPKGLDHILFVIGLFLLSPRARPLLWQITAFTLAHTVTLALGLLDIVQLSPGLVEPLIAASIIYVGIENVFTDKLHRWRPAIVFTFGLLHGLGFAGVLQDVEIPQGQFIESLIAFNLGLELGQLAIIACCFAFLGWFIRASWYRGRIAVPISILIAITGSFWLLERVGLLPLTT